MKERCGLFKYEFCIPTEVLENWRFNINVTVARAAFKFNRYLSASKCKCHVNNLRHFCSPLIGLQTNNRSKGPMRNIFAEIGRLTTYLPRILGKYAYVDGESRSCRRENSKRTNLSSKETKWKGRAHLLCEFNQHRSRNGLPYLLMLSYPSSFSGDIWKRFCKYNRLLFQFNLEFLVLLTVLLRYESYIHITFYY